VLLVCVCVGGGGWVAVGEADTAGAADEEGEAEAGSCTFQQDHDVGMPNTIVDSIPGLVDQGQCCAACYASPKCTVAIVLPATVAPGPGCWLKSGEGAAYAKKGAVACRTTR